jgi:hypothetical protein
MAGTWLGANTKVIEYIFFFQRLLRRHNQTNDSGVMVSKSRRWLLEILIWTKWRDLSTSEFEINGSKTCSTFEYQSRREFHKLSKEIANSELW